MANVGVFPAFGSIGTSIYRHLLEILSANELVLISRYPEKIYSDYIQAGVITRKADYNAPETLDGVFEGLSHLILISFPGFDLERRFQVWA